MDGGAGRAGTGPDEPHGRAAKPPSTIHAKCIATDGKRNISHIMRHERKKSFGPCFFPRAKAVKVVSLTHDYRGENHHHRASRRVRALRSQVGLEAGSCPQDLPRLPFAVLEQGARPRAPCHNIEGRPRNHRGATRGGGGGAVEA